MGDESLNNLTEEQVRLRIAEAEQTIVESETKMKRFKALDRMKKTDDYKEVFECGYFDEYANELFQELTNPPQFARIPFKDCEDLLCGIKAMKSYVGSSQFKGKVEEESEIWSFRKEKAQSVINAIST